MEAELAHKGVGCAGAEAAEEADESREARRKSGRRLDDEDRAHEGENDAEDFNPIGPFADDKSRDDHREKRRHFVENIGVRQTETVDGVEIAEQAQRPAEGAHKQAEAAAFLGAEALFRSAEDHRRDDEGDEISKQCLFKSRERAGLFDEQTHQRKTESGADNEKYAEGMIVVAVFCK